MNKPEEKSSFAAILILVIAIAIFCLSALIMAMAYGDPHEITGHTVESSAELLPWGLCLFAIIAIFLIILGVSAILSEKKGDKKT